MGKPACALSSFIPLLPYRSRNDARLVSVLGSMRESTHLALSLGLPERLDDLGERRSHREHVTHTQSLQGLDVARRNDTADDHRDVIGVVRPQPVEHAARKEQVRSEE